MFTAVITTAEQSRGAHAFADSLTRHGFEVTFRTLIEEATRPAHADLKVDRSLPPYDLPVRAWNRDPAIWWNTPVVAHQSWDKMQVAQAAVEAGIPHVPTIAFSYLDTEVMDSGQMPAAERAQELVALSGLPLVVKPTGACCGTGVTLVDDIPGLRYEMAHLGSGVVQPYIPEGRQTIRVVAAAGQVISAYIRTAPAGAWRANVAQGATVSPLALDPDMSAIALQAAAVLGLDFAGIDIIDAPDGPLLLEVNPAFGVDGLLSLDETAVDRLIATLIEHKFQTR